VLFAAATGLRPSEWIALEHRDIDHQAGVLYVKRAFRNGRLKCPKTDASTRAVPLQAIARIALEELPPRPDSPLVFPAARGGYLDLHNFRYREWKPAQRELGIDPIRRIYDLRAFLCHIRATSRHLHIRPLPVHGRQPDDDRPPLRPPRQRRPPERDQPPRHVQRGRPSDVHQRGRCEREVDAEQTPRWRSRSSKNTLSREKPKEVFTFGVLQGVLLIATVLTTA
jgi:integrase